MYHFIVNPNARSGLGHQVWRELETILTQKHISYHVYFTKYQKHAAAIAEKITSDGEEHIIVALGGDGTANEVINGIKDYEKTVFGYIPIGSSNDLARGLHIPPQPVAALELVLSAPRIRKVNIGILEHQNKHRNFIVSAGIGFDAAICHQAAVSKLKLLLNRLKLGKLTYAAIALHRLFLTTPQETVITLDQHRKLRFSSAYFAAVMNCPYEGGGLKFCPNAQPDDDKLDIMVVSDIPKWKILAILPTAFKGRHTRFKGVQLYTGKHVTIETKKALPVHTDGEPVFLQHRVTVSCAPEKLRVITPNC